MWRIEYQRTVTPSQRFVGYVKGDQRNDFAIIKSSNPTSIFKGWLKQGIYDGLGSLNSDQGTYTGEFLEGRMHGIGALELNNQKIMIGTFRNQSLYGIAQILDKKKHTVKKGHFKEGKINGFGVIDKNRKSEVYKGYLIQNIPHGLGSFTKPQCSYIGGYISGKRQGLAILRTSLTQQEKIYKGYFNDDKREGFGVEETISFDIFKGEFYDNQRSGIGILQIIVEGSKYIGGFKNSKRHGPICKFSSSNTDYLGSYKDNKMHGLGLITIKSKFTTYFGYFKEGRMDGIGIELSEHLEYRGQFKNGKKHGLGLLKKKKESSSTLARFCDGEISRVVDDELDASIKKTLETLDQQEFKQKYLNEVLKITEYVKEQETDLLHKLKDFDKDINDEIKSLDQEIILLEESLKNFYLRLKKEEYNLKRAVRIMLNEEPDYLLNYGSNKTISVELHNRNPEFIEKIDIFLESNKKLPNESIKNQAGLKIVDFNSTLSSEYNPTTLNEELRYLQESISKEKKDINYIRNRLRQLIIDSNKKTPKVTYMSKLLKSTNLHNNTLEKQIDAMIQYIKKTEIVIEEKSSSRDNYSRLFIELNTRNIALINLNSLKKEFLESRILKLRDASPATRDRFLKGIDVVKTIRTLLKSLKKKEDYLSGFEKKRLFMIESNERIKQEIASQQEILDGFNFETLPADISQRQAYWDSILLHRSNILEELNARKSELYKEKITRKILAAKVLRQTTNLDPESKEISSYSDLLKKEIALNNNVLLFLKNSWEKLSQVKKIEIESLLKGSCDQQQIDTILVLIHNKAKVQANLKFEEKKHADTFLEFNRLKQSLQVYELLEKKHFFHRKQQKQSELIEGHKKELIDKITEKKQLLNQIRTKTSTIELENTKGMQSRLSAIGEQTTILNNMKAEVKSRRDAILARRLDLEFQINSEISELERAELKLISASDEIDEKYDLQINHQIIYLKRQRFLQTEESADTLTDRISKEEDLIKEITQVVDDMEVNLMPMADSLTNRLFALTRSKTLEEEDINEGPEVEINIAPREMVDLAIIQTVENYLKNARDMSEIKAFPNMKVLEVSKDSKTIYLGGATLTMLNASKRHKQSTFPLADIKEIKSCIDGTVLIHYGQHNNLRVFDNALTLQYEKKGLRNPQGIVPIKSRGKY